MASVKPIPEGYHTVTPYLFIKGAANAIEFYKNVFGAQEVVRMPGPNGRIMHAELKIGDSLIMISHGDGLREPVSAFLYVYVENVDMTYQRAVEAGAETLELPSDQVYGDRRAMVKDQWGNLWQIASRL